MGGLGQYTILLLLKLVLLNNLSNCKEIKSSSDALQYLKHFGYLPKMTADTDFRHPLGWRKEFSKGLSTFQMYAGLKQSGKLDKDTMEMMNMPRCGMTERMEIIESKSINMINFSHKIPKRKGWNSSKIYYRVANFPGTSEMDPDVVREEIGRAFRMWEQVANLQCIEVEGENESAEIDINFLSREHGDGVAFGNFNEVAHAFFPNHHEYEGDIHFDNERRWTASNTTSGINLFQIAAHEIGHALGLDHSLFKTSVMHMIVQSELNEDFKLHEDDIQGIQNLYGPQRKQRVLHPVDNNESFQLDPSTHVNMIITVPMNGEDVDKFSPLEQSLSNFWTCFSISHSSTARASDCYKQNVLRLLYSLKIV